MTLNRLTTKIGSITIASALLLGSGPAVMAASSTNSGYGSASASTGTTSVSEVSSNSTSTASNSNTNVEAKLTKEDAIQSAKKYVEIPAGYKLQSANLNSDWSPTGTRSVWYLYFTKQEGDLNYGNISVNVDANTGALLGFNIYENDPDQRPSFPPKVNFGDAKEIANQWLSKANASVFNQLKYNGRYEDDVKPPLDGYVQYNFTYERVVNGVPFPQDSVTVSVNGDGKVINYYSNWTDNVKFENKDQIISLEEATQEFRNKSKLGLLYQVPYQVSYQGNEKKAYTAYTLETYMMNAKTGEWWSQFGDPISPTADEKPLADKPLAEKPAANKNLSKDDAVKAVEKSFRIPSNFTLQNASYNEYFNIENGETVSSWNLSWGQSGDQEDIARGRIGSIWANVNAKTGEVMNFSHYIDIYDPRTGEPLPVKPTVTSDEAKSKAIEFVKKMVPHYAHELVPISSRSDVVIQEKASKTEEFNFKHISDGVAIGYNNVSVTIDMESGDVVNYYANFSLTKYPTKKPDVISEEKAKELLLSQFNIELSYVLPYAHAIPYQKYAAMAAAGEPVPDMQQPEVQEAKLVYQLISKYQREPFFLDAESGVWKSMSTGEPISLVKEQATDIEGHWAKDALQLMLDYQALEIKDGKVNPNEAITKGEMIKMLVITMNGGYYPGMFDIASRENTFSDVQKTSKYFQFVEMAFDRRLIDKSEKFNPEQKMTREDMAELIVRALGYRKLSQFDAIFNKNFSDLDEVKNPGAASLTVGLGIMSADNGKFNPHKEVTRAEAASAFYRYLQKRSMLQESGYYY